MNFENGNRTIEINYKKVRRCKKAIKIVANIREAIKEINDQERERLVIFL